MNLIDELSGALRDRAEGVEAPPALAGRALARGKALRRRRRIAALAAPAVAAAIAVTTTVLVANEDGGPLLTPAPAVTSTISPSPEPTTDALPGAEPERPYAFPAAQPGGAGSLHWLSHDVDLPPGLVVTHLQALLDGGAVVTAEGPSGAVVYVARGDGALDLLEGVTAPAVADLATYRLAGRATDRDGMVLVDLATRQTIATLPGDRDPLVFAAGNAVVVNTHSPAPGRLGIWDVRSGGISEIPGGKLAPGSVVKATQDGRIVLVAEVDRLRAVYFTGGELWTRPGNYREGTAFAPGEGGQRVALIEPDGSLAVVNARDGRTVLEARGFPFEAAAVEWTGSAQVIVSSWDPKDNDYDPHLICTVGATGDPCRQYDRQPAVLQSFG